MIDHNHFICHFIFGGHLLNIPKRLDSKEDKKKFKEAVKRGCKDAITFKPTIEYLP